MLIWFLFLLCCYIVVLNVYQVLLLNVISCVQSCCVSSMFIMCLCRLLNVYRVFVFIVFSTLLLCLCVFSIGIMVLCFSMLYCVDAVFLMLIVCCMLMVFSMFYLCFSNCFSMFIFFEKKSVFSRFITSLVVLFSYCVCVVFSMFVMIKWCSQCFFEKKFDVLCFNFHSAFMLLSPCLYCYSIVSQCLDVLTGFLYGYNVFDVFLNVHVCCFTWFVNSYMFLKLFSQCV